MEDRADRLAEHRPRVSTALKNVLTNSNLCDVWRRLNPQVKRYTWMRKTLSLPTTFIRLDLIDFMLIPLLYQLFALVKLFQNYTRIIVKLYIFSGQIGKWKNVILTTYASGGTSARPKSKLSPKNTVLDSPEKN